jgi:hypothetical protein
MRRRFLVEIAGGHVFRLLTFRRGGNVRSVPLVLTARLGFLREVGYIFCGEIGKLTGANYVKNVSCSLFNTQIKLNVNKL